MKSPKALNFAPRVMSGDDTGSLYRDQMVRWTGDVDPFLRELPLDEYRYVYVPANAGAPTLTPRGIPNAVPLAIDTTNGRLYYYAAAAWSYVDSTTPKVVAKVKLTAQAAAIAATTIYAVPATGAGAYRVVVVASVTRAATTSSILGGTNGFQLVFTNDSDNVAKTTRVVQATTNAGNTTGDAIGQSAAAYCKASTNLQYSYDYTSVGITTMLYDLEIMVEYLGPAA